MAPALALLLIVCACGTALAQGFAAPRPPAATGLAGWILARQSEFYWLMSRALKEGQGWGLIGLAFLYGAFHAAGPGHGKAVISSYIVANDETVRRGILLSALSALTQALVALSLVAVMSVVLRATAKAMDGAVWSIEIAAFGLMTAMGLMLLWRKSRALIAIMRGWWNGTPVAALCEAGCTHGPSPADLAARRGWRDMAAVVLSTGLRPCSGALIILVFALSQGAFWLGAAATFAMAGGTAITIAVIAALALGAKRLAVKLASNRPGGAMVVMALAEWVAALVVTAFGALLLTGYLISEKTALF